MKRSTLTIGLLAAWLLAACAQSQTERWPGDHVLPQTRAELYQQYGVPDAIRVQGEDRWLRYDHVEAKGMTLGARYYALGFIIGRSQSYGDHLLVRVNPDDRITAVQPDVNSDQLRYRPWPFGD